MTVPGSNVLARAARIISLATVQYSAWLSSTKTAGVLVPTYATAVPIAASVQAVPRRLYAQWGLDFQRDYRILYTQAVLRDVQRDRTPDVIDFNGQRYNVESNTPWSAIDGWRECLVVRIGPTP